MDLQNSWSRSTRRSDVSKSKRSQRGITTVALVLFMAFFAVLPLSIFGFELTRYTLMQSQLQSCADAAALAGTAALASSPTGTIATQHQLAMDVAALTFRQNTILKTRFTNSNVAANTNSGFNTNAPSLYNATLNIRLMDQNGAPQPTGSVTATVMRVEALYTDRAIFASNLFPTGFLETAMATADGGLPQLDLMLCFDISGSMDDQTPVTLVKRYWGGASGVQYANIDSGTIYNMCRPASDGTGLNALQPQNLSYASYPVNTRPHTFSESSFPAGNLLLGLRGNQTTYPAGSLPPPISPAATRYPLGTLIPEQGLPPGNFDPTNRNSASGNGLSHNAYPGSGFTDMVMTTVPATGGFTFPNLATLVEASRGNMESASILLQSQGGVSINPSLPPPQAGYYNAYWTQVRALAQPIKDARDASANFFQIMNTSSNAHFGLVTFADAAGTGPASTYTAIPHNTDVGWVHGGNQAFPLPMIGLSKTASNFQDCVDGVQGIAGTRLPLGPTGATNISDSLRTSIDQLIDSSKFRSKAKKAIILFTDGVPNRPTGSGENDSYTQANRARTNNIPIYTIGLSQNALIINDQDRVLTDSISPNPPGNGIARRSRNGAIYIRVTNSNALNQAFQTIARSLVVLQQ